MRNWLISHIWMYRKHPDYQRHFLVALAALDDVVAFDCVAHREARDYFASILNGPVRLSAAAAQYIDDIIDILDNN